MYLAFFFLPYLLVSYCARHGLPYWEPQRCEDVKASFKIGFQWKVAYFSRLRIKRAFSSKKGVVGAEEEMDMHYLVHEKNVIAISASVCFSTSVSTEVCVGTFESLHICTCLCWNI